MPVCRALQNQRLLQPLERCPGQCLCFLLETGCGGHSGEQAAYLQAPHVERSAERIKAVAPRTEEN